MTNFVPDNSVNDIKKVVLWQYDNAYRLLTLLHVMKSYYDVSVKLFWDAWINDVLNVDTCTDFGAAVWGLILGIRRPNVIDSSSGQPIIRTISLKMYRRLLKGTFLLCKQNCDSSDISEYLMELFSVDINGSKYCGVKVKDNLDMSITFEKSDYFDAMDLDQQLVFEQLFSLILPFPLGIRYNYLIGGAIFGFYKNTPPPPKGPLYVYKPDIQLAEGSVWFHMDDKFGISMFKVVTPQGEGISSIENTSWDAVKDSLVSISLENSQIHASFAETTPAKPYKPNTKYLFGETVSYEGKTYFCRKDIPITNNPNWATASTWFQECWETIIFAKNRTPFAEP